MSTTNRTNMGQVDAKPQNKRPSLTTDRTRGTAFLAAVGWADRTTVCSSPLAPVRSHEKRERRRHRRNRKSLWSKWLWRHDGRGVDFPWATDFGPPNDVASPPSIGPAVAPPCPRCPWLSVIVIDTGQRGGTLGRERAFRARWRAPNRPYEKGPRYDRCRRARRLVHAEK